MDLFKVLKKKQLTTPVMIFDKKHLKAKAKKYQKVLNKSRIFYAIKANSNPTILKTLHELGYGFEVASLNELKKVLAVGSSPSDIICSNPVKTQEFIDFSMAKGMVWFSVDSAAEIDKFEKHAQAAKLYIRLIVDNSRSDYPLFSKFGVDQQRALNLIEYAKSKGIQIVGVNFHVGSQCRNIESWKMALDTVKTVFDTGKTLGMEMNFIDLGGGLPVQYLDEIPAIEDIASEVFAYINEKFASFRNLTLCFEPGRAIVGDSCSTIATVVGETTREGKNILTLDIGIFSGLIELHQGFKYKVEANKSGKTKKYRIYGPSCDSMDLLYEEVSLPEVHIGDKILIRNTGAYSIEYASNFNGFYPPSVIFV